MIPPVECIIEDLSWHKYSCGLVGWIIEVAEILKKSWHHMSGLVKVKNFWVMSYTTESLSLTGTAKLTRDGNLQRLYT